MKESNISANILYVKSYALLFFIYLFVGCWITILTSVYYSSIIIAVIGALIFIFAPIFYQNQVILMFSKQVRFTFEYEFVLIEIFNLKTGNSEKKLQHKYSEIKSFWMSSTSNLSSTIKLSFFNSPKFQCTFYNADAHMETTDGIKSIVGAKVLKKLYELNKRIILITPFYDTKIGKLTLTAIVAIYLIDFIINLLYFERAIPVTLITGLFLLVQIISRSIRDKRIFKQLNLELEINQDSSALI